MKKKKVSKRKQMRLMIFGIPSLFVIIYFSITLVSYIFDFSSLNKEKKQLNIELLNLQEQKHDLKIEIQKLNDPDYVARYAKEKFLYSKNGEYVLKLTDDAVLENNDIEKKNNFLIVIIAISVFLLLIYIFGKKKKSNES